MSRRPSLTKVVETLGHTTYRQADYWLREGYIQTANNMPGSGYKRSIDPHTVAALNLMDDLIGLGIPPATAATLAETFLTNPAHTHRSGQLVLTYDGGTQ